MHGYISKDNMYGLTAIYGLNIRRFYVKVPILQYRLKSQNRYENTFRRQI